VSPSCVLPRLPVADVDATGSRWEGWREDAACRGQTTEDWFPHRGESSTVALAACRVCPVVTPCLLAGLHETEGIWGGVSARQRRSFRTYLRKALGVAADEEDDGDEEFDAA